jgi:hypothetical protein
MAVKNWVSSHDNNISFEGIECNFTGLHCIYNGGEMEFVAQNEG